MTLKNQNFDNKNFYFQKLIESVIEWHSLIDISLIHLQGGSQNLNVNPPLSPGIWTVLAFHEDRKLLSSEFLIVPLPDDHKDYPSGEHPSQKKWEQHLEPKNSSSSSSSSSSNFLARNSLLKSNAQSYLDRVTQDLYSVEDVCHVATISPCRQSNILLSCAQTDWSSFSPDPKSQLP